MLKIVSHQPNKAIQENKNDAAEAKRLAIREEFLKGIFSNVGTKKTDSIDATELTTTNPTEATEVVAETVPANNGMVQLEKVVDSKTEMENERHELSVNTDSENKNFTYNDVNDVTVGAETIKVAETKSRTIKESDTDTNSDTNVLKEAASGTVPDNVHETPVIGSTEKHLVATSDDETTKPFLLKNITNKVEIENKSQKLYVAETERGTDSEPGMDTEPGTDTEMNSDAELGTDTEFDMDVIKEEADHLIEVHKTTAITRSPDETNDEKEAKRLAIRDAFLKGIFSNLTQPTISKSILIDNGEATELAVIADHVTPKVHTEVFVPNEISAEVQNENNSNTDPFKVSDGEENDNNNAQNNTDRLSLHIDECNLQNLLEEHLNLDNNLEWLNRELTRSPSLCSDISLTNENGINMEIDHFSQQPDSGTSSVTSFTFEDRAKLDSVSSENMFNAATLGRDDDPGYQTRHASEEQDITFNAKTLDRATNEDKIVEATSNSIDILPVQTAMQSILQNFQTTNYTLVLSIHKNSLITKKFLFNRFPWNTDK